MFMCASTNNSKNLSINQYVPNVRSEITSKRRAHGINLITIVAINGKQLQHVNDNVSSKKEKKIEDYINT